MLYVLRLTEHFVVLINDFFSLLKLKQKKIFKTWNRISDYFDRKEFFNPFSHNLEAKKCWKKIPLFTGLKLLKLFTGFKIIESFLQFSLTVMLQFSAYYTWIHTGREGLGSGRGIKHEPQKKVKNTKIRAPFLGFFTTSWTPIIYKNILYPRPWVCINDLTPISFSIIQSKKGKRKKLNFFITLFKIFNFFRKQIEVKKDYNCTP